MSLLHTPLKEHTGIWQPGTYPVIRHLDDIAPHIAHNRAIRTFVNGPITVIRYLINDPAVFQTPYDLEARGLIFDSNTGALLSRPLHKFFTFTGAPHQAAEMLQSGATRLYDKLDGTMLGGLVLEGEVRLHTKAGFTRHAHDAQARLTPHRAALIREACADGYTPIFEEVGPGQRIVLAYEAHDLVLLALRHRDTGLYDEARADAMAQAYGVARPAILAEVQAPEDLAGWASRVANMTGVEGVVAVAPDGRRAKIKTRAYLSVHKALTMLSTERHAFRAVIEEIDDDLVPLLPPAQAAFFEGYARALRARILELGQEAEGYAATLAGLEGADLAAKVRQTVPPSHHLMVFGLFKGKAPAEVLQAALAKRTGSQANVEEAKAAYGLPDWAPPAGLFLQD